MGCNNSAPPSSCKKKTMKTEMTDRQLVTLVLGGKTQAYSDIVSRHSALVFAKAMGVVRCRDLAAEIAQQTFVRAYTRLADWHGDDSIAPWLAMIAVRLSLTQLDTARRRRAGQLDHDVPYEDYSPRARTPPATHGAGRLAVGRARQEHRAAALLPPPDHRRDSRQAQSHPSQCAGAAQPYTSTIKETTGTWRR